MFINTTSAYIAGFLDGDGSIIFQIVRRRDYRLGFQIRVSVCSYQNRSGLKALRWLKNQLGIGTIRERAGDMCNLTIVGVEPATRILRTVQPYVVFKRRQVELGLELLAMLREIEPGNLAAFQSAPDVADRFALLNYSKKRTITAKVVREHLSVIERMRQSQASALSQPKRSQQ